MQCLLVDDDPVMHTIVKEMLELLTHGKCHVVTTDSWVEALKHASAQPFDLILLDNRLSRDITAKITVPGLKKAKYQSPIAIISSDVSHDYLNHPSILGVNYIIDKSRLTAFLSKQVKLTNIVGSVGVAG